MKNKSKLFTLVVILLLLFAVVFIQSYNLNNINTTIESMKSYEIEYNNLEERITSIENQINKLKVDMPDQNIDQLMELSIQDLNRLENLLNKVDGLETIFGIITDLDKSSETILEVRLVDSQDIIQITLAKNCTVYVAGQFTIVPIDTNEFIKMVEQDLKNEFQQGFTFKLVKGKAIQIYQGWGELN